MNAVHSAGATVPVAVETSSAIRAAESPVATADGRRTAKRFSPKTAIEVAVSQYPMGGFSK
jgi:hypothetical protein